MDPSEHFLGLRLNMYVASVLTIVGIVWFVYSQRHGRPAAELPARRPDSEADSARAAPESDPSREPGRGPQPAGGFRSAGGLQSRGLQRGRARHRHGLTATPERARCLIR